VIPARLRSSLAAGLVLAIATTSAQMSRADPLHAAREAYNQDARRLNAGRDDSGKPEVAMTPADADRRFNFGPVDLDNLRQLSDHPDVDTALVLRATLTVAAAEETVSTAAPIRVRLYGAPASDGARAFVPLDVSLLDAATQSVIARHCETIPCPVTIQGRIGEVEAERVSNLFSDTGAVTVMVGVVAEHLRFHEAAP